MEKKPAHDDLVVHDPVAEKKSASSKKAKKQSPTQLFLLGIIGAVVIAFGVSFLAVKEGVKNVSTTPFVLRFAETFKMPVAKVNDKNILYSDYHEDVTTLQTFFASAPEGFPPPTPQQLSEQVLSRLFINVIIVETAAQYDVGITDEDREQAKQDIISNFETEEAAEAELLRTYGWDLETFLVRVMEPVILEGKVREAYEADSTDAEGLGVQEVRARHILFSVEDESEDEAVRQQAEEVLQRIKDGEDFATLAAEFGSDGTKDTGGDLGFFGPGRMVAEFEEAAFGLQVGQVADELVKTQFGYHIIETTDERTVRSFDEYMRDQILNAEVHMYAELSNPFDSPDVQNAMGLHAG